MREKELKRHNNRLDIVKCAGQSRITIPPNTSVEIKGYLDNEVPYKPTPCIVQTIDLAPDL